MARDRSAACGLRSCPPGPHDRLRPPQI